MKYVFVPKGVCSREIAVDLDDNGVIQACKFRGGCAGNLSGISQLIIGMKAEDVIGRVRGTKCGFKATSCPDQLSYALEEALASGN